MPIESAPVPTPAPKPGKAARPKQTIDPQLLTKSRELRDRYLEHLTANPSAAQLPASCGKYDVSRALPSAIRDPQSAIAPPAIPCLPAA